MASSSSSIANFLSLFIPSKAPPKSLPPTHLSFSSDSAPNSSSSPKNRDWFAPLVATSELDNRDPVLFSSACPNDLMSVVCPSLAYANTLFFRSAYNVQVIVDDNEPEEKLLNRFRREVMKAGVIQECKRRRFFENKQDKEKRKTREAAKRNRRRRTPFRSATQDKVETTNKKREDDDDNWDMPDAGSLPA